MPQISIIMPLYNAQKYLAESLDSVLHQTFTDYELICINDASNDDTKSILRKYQALDIRIRILENRTRLGAAYSRNKGIEESRGKYVIFLDGDDIFEEEMLSISYETAEKNNTDVLMFNYKHLPSSQIHEKVQVSHGDKFVEKYCKKVFCIAELKPYEFLLWSSGPCNRLFKKSFIVDNEIFFQDLPCSNDVYFVNMALLLSKKTMMLKDSRIMIYARDHDEPSRISSKRDPMCCFEAYRYLLKMLIRKEKLDMFYQHFFYKAFFAFRYVLISTEKKSIQEARTFYEFLQEEGINQLRQLSKDFADKGNQYINYIFDYFENSSFDTKWYEKESILKIYLNDNKEEFKNLFTVQTENKKIAIWGTGQIGQLVLENCEIQGITVDYVVDINKEKQGKSIKGYCIMEPNKIVDQVDLILVTAYGISNEVQQFVRQHGSKANIVDIHNFMSID